MEVRQRNSASTNKKGHKGITKQDHNLRIHGEEDNAVFKTQGV